MITLLISLLVVYLLSVYAMYKYFQYACYHPEGRWFNLKPEIEDIFLTFFPLFNTIVILVHLTTGWKDTKFQHKKEFFKPKKPLK